MARRNAPVIILLLAAVVAGAGCATNPVTGRRQLRLISESSEISMGESAYVQQQQAQGGTYTAHPEVAEYVQAVTEKLREKSDRPELPYEIVILNNDVPNAWALPGGKMAVNRGLLTELKSESELAAVLAHEIVHVAAGHGAQSVQRGMGTELVLGGIGIALRDRDYSDLILAGAGAGGALVNLKYGRADELESDEYGIKYMARAGYDPRSAIALQETFLRLANGKDQGWLAGLLSTHPPSKERVDRNRATCAKYPPGGFIGTEEYARAMVPLRTGKSAYEAVGNGFKALQAGRSRDALALADQAIRQEPREALGYGLKAKALAAEKQYPRALEAIGKAIALNDSYFDYYLTRAQLRQAAGDSSGARADYARSTTLLPTATAHYQLGMIDLNSGDKRSALEHLQRASGANSTEGRRAAAAFARVAMPERPEQFLEVSAGLSPQRRLVVRVANRAAVDVTLCRIGVYSPLTGKWESYELRGLASGRSGVIQAGQTVYPADNNAVGGVRVRIEKAVPAGE